MAKPTERALKRKPMAVILLTTLRKDVPEVPPAGREFEWFETADGRKTFFNQSVAFHKEDTKEHDDMAYLAIEITDTKSEPMTVGRIDHQPSSDDKVTKWRDAVAKDITKAFLVEQSKTSPNKDGTKKVVRPRKKSEAAQNVVADKQPDQKAKRLKERLAAKKTADVKSETGDKPAPRPRAPRKAAANKPAPA